jgi:hypothetical protein
MIEILKLNERAKIDLNFAKIEMAKKVARRGVTQPSPRAKPVREPPCPSEPFSSREITDVDLQRKRG